MAQEQVFINDIISEHRERMVNLKKYYPFFCLCNNSFSQFKEGKYDELDMGYLTMAVLRFFIEENNFREKDVLYKEYHDFMKDCIKRDFKVQYSEEEYDEIIEYVFDKIKNDGHPFVFEYYDPVDRKKRVSRMKLLESSVKEENVWYSITSDAIEFYLDTKEIKDQSKISIQQLLLEKLIKAKNFKGGTEVIARINNEVSRLKYRKNEVVSLLAVDVFSGIEAYEDFVANGMNWFEEEEKLFVKNMELIEATLERAEQETEKNEAYYRTLNDIYQLATQLKIAMNKHSQLLTACTELSVKADEIIRKSKLRKLRNGFDFRNILAKMIKKDDLEILSYLITPLFDLNIKKSFNVIAIDDMLTYRPERHETVEKVAEEEEKEIIFPDEIEEKRMNHNFEVFMRELLDQLQLRERFSLKEFTDYLAEKYSEKIYKNNDYYAFLVHLCQKKKYRFDRKEKEETFLDGILADMLSGEEGYEEPSFEIIMNGDEPLEELVLNGMQVTNVIFERMGE
ncbi:MAG: hypothetical protein PUF12_08350 [Thermoflexaceae bacterium]|nr:hypothetical protein [Thermoflexaceae bacterium]